MSKRKRKVRHSNTNGGVLAPPRNPLFNHPLMKKSHSHDKTYKAKRRADKVKFSRDWYSQSSFSLFAIKTFLRIPALRIALAVKLQSLLNCHRC